MVAKKEKLNIHLGTMEDYNFIHNTLNSDDFRKWCASDSWDGVELSYQEELESSNIMKDHIVVGTINNNNVAFFSGRWLLPKVIQGHIYILPKFRKYSISLTNELINWAKTRNKFELLVAEIPEFNLPAIALAKLIGCRCIGWSDKNMEKAGRKWRCLLLMKEVNE